MIQKKKAEDKRADKATVAISDVANLGIETFSPLDTETCFADGYMSCTAIDYEITDNRIEKAHFATENVSWCLDSGCTTHASPIRSDFTNIQPMQRRIQGVGGAHIDAIGVGTIHLCCGKGRHLTLKDALYVPTSTLRLISIGRLDDDGLQSTFNNGRCVVRTHAGKVMAEGSRIRKDLYYLSGKPEPRIDTAFITRAAPDLETWHKRLGHINFASIIQMAKSGMALGMPVDLSSLPPLCEHCVVGKQTKTPVPKTRRGERAQQKLAKVFSDITGPEDVGSTLGEKYILNFIDDYTSMSWIFPLKRKSDAADVLQQWIPMVEKESGQCVKIFRTDNGGEYTSEDFERYLQREGIRHETTAPYTSAENGKAERCHRTIMNCACAIRSDSNLPPSLWTESVKAAAYLKNRTPTRTLKEKTPYEMWYGMKPDLYHLRELGCGAWVHIPGDNPKIYNRSVECILVGYSETSKAYRCLERATGKIHISQNVVFAESQDCCPRNLHPGIVINTSDEDKPITISEVPTPMLQEPLAVSEAPTPTLPDPLAADPVIIRRSTRIPKLSAAGAALKNVSYESLLDKAKREIHERAERTRLLRGGGISARINENPDEHEDTVGVLVAMTEEEWNKPCGDLIEVSEEEWCNAGLDSDPRTYREAMARDDKPLWEASMKEELDSTTSHGVWELVPCSQVPVDKRVIPSKWVFLIKRDESGIPKRHKSRIVAKGFAQRPGIDYTDTYAPVARMESVRMVLHIGAAMDWDIHQMDIKTAFLHGKLEEEVYMEQPEGCAEKGKENWVCRLKKTLYGLVQSPRMWNTRLNKVMVEIGYQRNSADHCVYVRTSKNGTSIVTIHVDDLCIASSTPEEMKQLKTDLGKFFDLVDLGEVRFLLGIAIKRDRATKTIALSQTSYIETITKRFQLTDSNPEYTPLDSSVTLSKQMCPKTDEEKEKLKRIPYLTAVGSLMYAAMGTRPDIAFAVTHLSQFNANPGNAHWTQAQQVIKYLYTTRHMSLVLGGEGIHLSGWGGCSD